MQKHVSKAAAKLVNTPLGSGSGQPVKAGAQIGATTKFTYALASFTAERRKDGWYAAKTVPAFTGDKPKWCGPFETIENACLSVARHLATELADRHTRTIESYKIKLVRFQRRHSHSGPRSDVGTSNDP